MINVLYNWNCTGIKTYETVDVAVAVKVVVVVVVAVAVIVEVVVGVGPVVKVNEVVVDV